MREKFSVVSNCEQGPTTVNVPPVSQCAVQTTNSGPQSQSPMMSTRSQSRLRTAPDCETVTDKGAHTLIATARQDQPAPRTLFNFFSESREAGPTRRQHRENLLQSINGPFNRTATGAIARCASRDAPRAEVALCVHVDALETAISARAIPVSANRLASGDHRSRRSTAAPTRADRAARSSRMDRKSAALAKFRRKPLPRPRDCARAWPRRCQSSRGDNPSGNHGVSDPHATKCHRNEGSLRATANFVPR